jgi:hypothetical protein
MDNVFGSLAPRQDDHVPFAFDRTGDMARAAGINDIDPLQRWFASNPLPPPMPVAPQQGLTPRPHVTGWDRGFLPGANDANFLAHLATMPPSMNLDDRRNIIPGLNREYFRLRDDVPTDQQIFGALGPRGK